MTTHPYARSGYVHLPLGQDTRRDILWRVGNAMAVHTDDTSLALLMLAEGQPATFDGWAARAEALTDAHNWTVSLTPRQARALANELRHRAADAEHHTPDDPDSDPVFRLCGYCKRLRPDTTPTGSGVRCADCRDHEEGIHHEHITA